MKDLTIKVSRDSRMVTLPENFIAIEGEELQNNLVFEFSDTFVDGQARLEYYVEGNKYYTPMTKTDEQYSLPIRNVITKAGKIKMQLVITEGTDEEDIPVFKSNIFFLYCNESINAVGEAPDGYQLWIEQANAKLNAMDEALAEVDNLDIDASKSGDTATVSITNKEGTTKTVQIKDGIDGEQGEAGPPNTLRIGTVTKGENASATITGDSPNQTLNLVLPKGDKGDKGDTGATGNDGYSPTASVTQFTGGATITITDKTGTTTATITSGEQGPAGKDGKDGVDGNDATINGVNAITIEAGTNISLDQSGSTLTISSTGGSGTSDYSDLTNKPSINNITLSGNKTSSDLGLASSSDIPDISGKQDIEDNSLDTVHKTVPTAINEVNSIAKGTNQALSYSSYSAMVTAFNGYASDKYNVGQNVMIVTVEVPDLWISSVESSSSTYTYVDDATIVSALQTNGYIQVGYYKLSMLETQKVDLTNYVTNTDYATTEKGGVFKTNDSYGTNVTSGSLRGTTKTYEQYTSGSDYLFVSKSTLENVITGKGLLDSSKVKTTTNTTSGNVYDVTYINTMLGDIETLLGGI